MAIPSWDTIKSELSTKWWIVVLCMIAGIYQGLCFIFPELPNPFKW